MRLPSTSRSSSRFRSAAELPAFSSHRDRDHGLGSLSACKPASLRQEPATRTCDSFACLRKSWTARARLRPLKTENVALCRVCTRVQKMHSRLTRQDHGAPSTTLRMNNLALANRLRRLRRLPHDQRRIRTSLPARVSAHGSVSFIARTDFRRGE